MANKKKANDLFQFRYELTDLYYAVKNDEIEIPKAKVMIGAASQIINTFKIETVNNQIIGNVAGIDYALNEETSRAKKQLS